MVNFYAPWCHHCKNMKPAYEEAAKILQQEVPPIPLTNCDATKAVGAAEHWEVTGYPDLRVFRKGVDTRYDGPNDPQSLVAYMREMAQPAARTLLEAADLDEFVNKAKDTVVVAVIADKEDASYTKYWPRFSQKLRDSYTFAEVSVKVAAASQILGNFPAEGKAQQAPASTTKNLYTVIRAKHMLGSDEPQVSGVSHWFEAMETVINSKGLPLVSQLDSKSITARVMSTKKPVVTLFFTVDERNPKHIRYIVSRYRKLAAKWSKKFTFTYADLATGKWILQLRYGIEQPKEFEVVVTKHGKHSAPEPANWHGQRWRTPVLTKQKASSFSAMELEPFLKRLDSGDQPEYLRSAPPPPPAERYTGAGPKQLKKATILTAKTFKKVVDHPKKDVLVCFHTSSLQDRKMLPAIDALAWLFENHTNVVVAKLNATENDIDPRYDVRGFPTLYFAPGSLDTKNEPIKIRGKIFPHRYLNDLRDTVIEYSQKPIDPDTLIPIEGELEIEPVLVDKDGKEYEMNPKDKKAAMGDLRADNEAKDVVKKAYKTAGHVKRSKPIVVEG